jgi:hypothetical protein
MGVQIEAYSRLVRDSTGLRELQRLGLVEEWPAISIAPSWGPDLAGDHWTGPGSETVDWAACTYAQYSDLCGWINRGPWAEPLLSMNDFRTDYAVWGPDRCREMAAALRELFDGLEPDSVPAPLQGTFNRPELERVIAGLVRCFEVGADAGLVIWY